MEEEEELHRMVETSNENENNGRIARLRVLVDNQTREGFFCHALAHNYFEEAKMCWYSGCYVSTIIMSQLAIEELLRSHYRNMSHCFIQEEDGTMRQFPPEDCKEPVLKWANRDSMKKGYQKVDSATFMQLVEEALCDSLITHPQADKLGHLKKALRNPYVHSEDVNGSSVFCPESRSSVSLSMKISSPGLIGDTVEEAETAIVLCLSVFVQICHRTFG